MFMNSRVKWIVGIVLTFPEILIFAQSVAESNIFSLNTVKWTLSLSSESSENGSVTGLGDIFDTTTATLTAIADPGYVFGGWGAAFLNTLTEVPLSSEIPVAVEGAVEGFPGYFVYNLNGGTGYNSERRYILKEGVYTFKNIPEEYPLAVLNAGKESDVTVEPKTANPVVIYVSGGSTISPFYEFRYSDGTRITGKIRDGYALMRGKTYRFIADNIDQSFPFSVNSLRFNSDIESWITGRALSGTGGTIELTIPADYVGPVSFYSESNLNTTGYFNLSISEVEGTIYDFYWGDVELKVLGDFGNLDLASLTQGYDAPSGILLYDDGSYISVDTNPLSFVPDRDTEIHANFIQDSSDSDGDGLTAYSELVVYGTDPALYDSDGDSHNDYTEAVEFSSDPLDSNSVPTFDLDVTINQGSVSGAGSIEIFTEVTLLATPDPGYIFSSWNGDLLSMQNPVSILMDSDKSIGAVLTEDQSDNDLDGLSNFEELVLYQTDPEDADSDNDGHDDFTEVKEFSTDPLLSSSFPTVTVSTSTVNGSIAGGGTKEYKTNTTLSAIPDEGFVFFGWSGDASGDANPLSLYLDSAKTVMAEFVSATNYNRVVSELSNDLFQNPEDYGFINIDLVDSGLSLGGMKIESNGTNKRVVFNIETSSDLENWSLFESVQKEIPTPQNGTIFIRVNVPN